MNIFAKLVRWLRPPADPEAEAEVQRQHAEWEAERERQIATAGTRGIPSSNLPPEHDGTDPWH